VEQSREGCAAVESRREGKKNGGKERGAASEEVKEESGEEEWTSGESLSSRAPDLD